MDFAEFLASLESEQPKQRVKPNIFVYALGAAVGGTAIILTAVSVPFLFPFFRRICLPYVPASTKQVENVMEALHGRSGKVIDLGSGDGRIVFAAAQNGFDATGIELNPWLVLYSKLASLKRGLSGRSKFYRRNIWNFNLKPYNNVVIFGVDTMMNDLEEKFQRELDKGTQIIACRFPLPNMKPFKTLGVGLDKVWVYTC